MSRHGGCAWGVLVSALAVGVVLSPGARAQSVGRLPDPSGSSGASSAPSGTTSFPPSGQAPSSPPPAPPDPSASRYPRETSQWPAAQQSPTQAHSAASGYSQPFAAATPSVGAGSTGFYPPVLPHRDGQPVPPGYRLEERSNRGLSHGGIVTFGIAYAAGLGYGVASGFEEGTGWMALPVVGPWAAIAAQEIKCRKPTVANPDVGDECVEKALGGAERITFFTVDGLIQAVGVTMIFVGMGIKTTELVRNDVATVRLHLKPRSLGVTGTF